MAKQQPSEHDLTGKDQERKKPYRAPRLVEYGDLQKITLTKGGMMNDPGNPGTRK